MSGHSKWSTIKRKKGANDAQRAKIFTKIAREIVVAVKSGGPDPDNNSSLKDAIAKGRANNMPNENIQRTIKKAAGDTDSDNYENITYEGYGLDGVAVIVEALTDNRNRTAADVRHAFDKFGGNMGQTGCVSFMFDKKGIIVIEKNDIDEDEITMDALEAGAEDISGEDECYEITTSPEDFHAVRDALESKYEFASAEITMVPQTTVTITDEDHILKMQRMIDALEDSDDVQN
ncbi:MAG: YebC/PmpR family DNA-binding transcriptional regulator, partial [Clostridia bacterium]|nr:YebC/PmpR family DNA-binding transcriptional regulator [Clostridia bacterium]